jgi:hypothetical protein
MAQGAGVDAAAGASEATLGENKSVKGFEAAGVAKPAIGRSADGGPSTRLAMR